MDQLSWVGLSQANSLLKSIIWTIQNVKMLVPVSAISILFVKPNPNGSDQKNLGKSFVCIYFLLVRGMLRKD